MDVPPAQIWDGEFYFLKLMAEEIDKAYEPGTFFRKESQLHVNRKFRIAFGPLYSDRSLKARLGTLKARYQSFSELLSHEGVFWNEKDNTLHGSEKILREKFKYRRTHGNYVGERNFDIMRQVFERGVTFDY